MLNTQVESALQQLELRSAAVAQALADGDPASLEQASTQMRALAVALADFVQGLGADQRREPQLAQRLQQASRLMAAQRQGLARRAVMVERALSVLVPSATRTPTYGHAGRAAASYGSPVRQSGAFTVLAA